jgi:predicted nicotinamide N-methyase
MIPASPERFQFGPHQFIAYIPDVEYIRQKKLADPGMPFPYWSKVWHSSIALCQYLASSPDLIQNKKIIEVGAGLGIPSLFSSHIALDVVASDINPEAIEMIERSADQNGFKNVKARILDIHSIRPDLSADVFLFSDINYDLNLAQALERQVNGLIARQKTIILSTPNRIIANPVIERLSTSCTQRQVLTIDYKSEKIDVLILTLADRVS